MSPTLSSTTTTSSSKPEADYILSSQENEQERSIYSDVRRIVEAYRTWGHLYAHLNPLKSKPPLYFSDILTFYYYYYYYYYRHHIFILET